jgi:HNH endonuclease
MITYGRARELLNYDQDTGIFTWRVDRGGGVKAGAVPGRVNARGYYQLILDNRLYQAHRVAWLMINCEWPADEIDHINRIKTDNRIANLRVVTRAQNAQNRRGPRGVYFDGARDRRKPWKARIGQRHVGYFATLDEAIEARRKMLDDAA